MPCVTVGTRCPPAQEPGSGYPGSAVHVGVPGPDCPTVFLYVRVHSVRVVSGLPPVWPRLNCRDDAQCAPQPSCFQGWRCARCAGVARGADQLVSLQPVVKCPGHAVGCGTASGVYPVLQQAQVSREVFWGHVSSPAVLDLLDGQPHRQQPVVHVHWQQVRLVRGEAKLDQVDAAAQRDGSQASWECPAFAGEVRPECVEVVRFPFGLARSFSICGTVASSSSFQSSRGSRTRESA
jgi:hypothetical protein